MKVVFSFWEKTKIKMRAGQRFVKSPNFWFYIAAFFGLVYLISQAFQPQRISHELLEEKLKTSKGIEAFIFENKSYSRDILFTLDSSNYLINELYSSNAEPQEGYSEVFNTKIKGLKELNWVQNTLVTRGETVWFWLAALSLGLGIFKYLSEVKNTTSDFVKEDIKVKFSQVAGIDTIRGELEEVVKHFLNEKQVKDFGGKVLRGVVLHGPPGTGKTLMAKAVAGETNSHFIAASGSQFIEMYVGVGPKRVREIFQKARANKPCVIFIDEIDSFAKKRGTSGGGAGTEYDSTVNEMLAQMDGFKDNDGILVIAATNNLESLDDALLRPGRFDRKIKVDLPSVSGRKKILDLYVDASKKMGKDVDTDQLSKMTTYFSGADLKNLVDEAVYLAIKEESPEVNMIHFIHAKDKIQLGTLRDIKLSQSEKELTAYHEMGHALISELMNVGEVNQISILPRGNALGVTHTTPEERFSYSRDVLNSQIMMLLGGKVAEKVAFNIASSGASNDLERATSIARKMICDLGMGSMGPISFQYGSQQYMNLSEKLKYDIDMEVLGVLKKAEEDTVLLLTEHRELLNKLSIALIEKETILSDEFKELIKAHRSH